MNRLKTADLYYAAYLLSRGDELVSVEEEAYPKRRVYFIFTGRDIGDHVLEYANSTAIVNLRDLKRSLRYLRDIIYQKIDQPTIKV